MHAGLLPNGRVVFLDKVENYTQIKLSDGQFAYSAEYDPATNTAVGLSYKVRWSFAKTPRNSLTQFCKEIWQYVKLFGRHSRQFATDLL